MEKRLYRSRKESMIAGVAGGLAEYFGIDPVLIRLLFVLAVIFHGMGLLAYIILWIVVPRQAEEAAPAGETPGENPGAPAAEAVAENGDRTRKRSRLGGYILIGIGVIFLADSLIPNFDLGEYWPVILIALGLGLLYNATKTKRDKE